MGLSINPYAFGASRMKVAQTAASSPVRLYESTLERFQIDRRRQSRPIARIPSAESAPRVEVSSRRPR